MELDLLKQVVLAAGAHMNVCMALCRRLEEKGQPSVCVPGEPDEGTG